ncbi:MAG: limonene-1,2-epoxide hydrolase family protein [Pseudomonadota bacterium]
MTPLATVEAFIDAWSDYDLETITSFLADDVEWTDVPLTTVYGIGEVRRKLAGFRDVEASAFEIQSIAVNGNVVLTERVDWFRITGRRRTIHVMGVFEINGEGKIRKWRDYFDSAEFYREFGDLASDA